jgi:hypothetical protein
MIKSIVTSIVFVLALFVACMVWGHHVKAQDQTRLDWEIITARTLTLEKIQQQIQPIIRERDDAAARLCGSAGLKPAECNINPDNRTVTKVVPKGK